MKTISFVFLFFTLTIASPFLMAAEKEFELRQDFTPLSKKGAADLWVPIPMDIDNYQIVI